MSLVFCLLLFRRINCRCFFKRFKKLSNYGKYLGISFQIVDDILGIFGDSKITGKPIGNDIIEGKKTIPIILVCEICDLKQKEKILSIINSKN
jgi:geranylgeranyl diphosphate synthase type I